MSKPSGKPGAPKSSATKKRRARTPKNAFALPLRAADAAPIAGPRADPAGRLPGRAREAESNVAIRLTPPRVATLEQAIACIDDD